MLGLSLAAFIIGLGANSDWKYFEWAGIFMRTEDPADRASPVHAYDASTSRWKDANLTAGVLSSLGCREVSEEELRERNVPTG